jgi:integrase
MFSIHLLRYQNRPLMRPADLPAEVDFHDLRHTAATLLLSRGINPKIVSEMLGHVSVAITLDIYSHVIPDMQQDATSAMGNLLST